MHELRHLDRPVRRLRPHLRPPRLQPRRSLDHRTYLQLTQMANCAQAPRTPSASSEITCLSVRVLRDTRATRRSSAYYVSTILFYFLFSQINLKLFLLYSRPRFKHFILSVFFVEFFLCNFILILFNSDATIFHSYKKVLYF